MLRVLLREMGGGGLLVLPVAGLPADCRLRWMLVVAAAGLAGAFVVAVVVGGGCWMKMRIVVAVVVLVL